MHTKNSKGIEDTEENERMSIGNSGNGTGTAQRNQKKEIIILWTRDEKRRRLSGERNHAIKALHREQENKANQGCDGWTT